MSLVYTHTLPGCPVGLEELLRRQSAVAAFGRVVAVATPSGVDFYDANSVTELSTVLDAGTSPLATRPTMSIPPTATPAGACKLRLLSSFPVVDAGQPVDVSAVTFLGSGLLSLAGWAGGASGATVAEMPTCHHLNTTPPPNSLQWFMRTSSTCRRRHPYTQSRGPSRARTLPAHPPQPPLSSTLPCR